MYRPANSYNKEMPMKVRTPLLLTLITAPLLTACGNSTQTEAARWMSAAARDLSGKVESVPEPRRYAPYKYEAAAQVDPFSAVKVALFEKAADKPRPVSVHAREVLEAFPLESLKMVGALEQKGAPYALVRSDGGLHRVGVGNYLGENDGRITAISESAITVSEVVRDAGGDWVQRESKLHLQQTQK